MQTNTPFLWTHSILESHISYLHLLILDASISPFRILLRIQLRYDRKLVFQKKKKKFNGPHIEIAINIFLSLNSGELLHCITIYDWKSKRNVTTPYLITVVLHATPIDANFVYL